MTLLPKLWDFTINGSLDLALNRGLSHYPLQVNKFKEGLLARAGSVPTR